MPVIKMIDRRAIVARVHDEVVSDVAEHKHRLPAVQDHRARLPAGGCDGDVRSQETEGGEMADRRQSMSEMLTRMRSTPEGYFTVRFGLPEYTDWMDESMSWKETCYIGDWSFLWERHFRGPDPLKLFSEVAVNNFDNFAHGQSKHVIHTNEDGKVIHEGILSRLGEEEFILFGRGGFWVDYQLRQRGYDVVSEPDD
jgi:Aminomethyltransferase folate-binding domain